MVAPRAETWKPGAAGVESVRQQARYDQSRTEEHPAADESDEDEDDEHNEQLQQRYQLYWLLLLLAAAYRVVQKVVPRF